MASLQPQREPPEPVGVEPHSERLQVLDAAGRLVHEDLRGRAPDELAPRPLGVRQVTLGAVVRGERGGETSLCPVARGLRQRGRRDEHDSRSLPGGAQRRIQPGRARPDHREIRRRGLCGHVCRVRAGWLEDRGHCGGGSIGGGEWRLAAAIF